MSEGSCRGCLNVSRYCEIVFPGLKISYKLYLYLYTNKKILLQDKDVVSTMSFRHTYTLLLFDMDHLYLAKSIITAYIIFKDYWTPTDTQTYCVDAGSGR